MDTEACMGVVCVYICLRILRATALRVWPSPRVICQTWIYGCEKIEFTYYFGFKNE